MGEEEAWQALLAPLPEFDSRYDTFKGRGIGGKIELEILGAGGIKTGNECVQAETKETEAFLADAEGIEEVDLSALGEQPEAGTSEHEEQAGGLAR